MHAEARSSVPASPPVDHRVCSPRRLHRVGREPEQPSEVRTTSHQLRSGAGCSRRSVRFWGLEVVREPAQGSASTQPSHTDAGYPPGAGVPVTFGQLLRAYRKQRGLSLTQLAAMVHFNRGHVSKIETDKRPPSVSFAEACDRELNVGNTFTTIASALEAAARHQQGWVQPAQLPRPSRTSWGAGIT